MEKRQNIRELLGLTQDELALLFRISRSQMAKYELGTRDLGIEAKYLLAEMLSYMESSEATSKTSMHALKQHAEMLDTLQRMQKENEYQLEYVSRKLNTFEKKHAYLMKTLNVGDFLATKDSKTGWFNDIVSAILNKAKKSLKVYGLSNLMKYEIKQEVLHYEKALIASRLEKKI